MPATRIFLTHWFRKFTRKERLSDAVLCEAIDRAEQGSVDAELGGGLIKQRVARSGQGRSGGYRTLIAWREEDRAVFLYGFAKSDRDNLEPAELAQYVKLAGEVLAMTETQIAALIESKRWHEVACDD